jgi:hypothetical protein
MLSYFGVFWHDLCSFINTEKRLTSLIKTTENLKNFSNMFDKFKWKKIEAYPNCKPCKHLGVILRNWT